MLSEFINQNLETLLSAEQISRRVREMGAEIAADYAGKKPLFICVLKGSCIFLADLIRAVDLRLDIDFMAVSSYGKSTKSSGIVRIIKDLSEDVSGRHLVVVEDIVDTGLTLSYLIENLNSRNPASVRLAALLDKPEPRIKKDLKIDYCGFQIPNQFVVGYGLDAAERFRNLPHIAVVKNPSEI